jgi:chemotaxis protein CheX
MESTGYSVSFINPILQAVANVLSKMAQVEVTPGKPYVNKERTAAGDVTGVIGLSGDLTGVLSVTFEKDVILKVTNTMLEESYTEMDGNIADAVGELTNMITGQARMHLSKEGMHLKASTPSVIMGKGHTISHITPAPILSIPFSTEYGSFVVEITMSQATNHNKFDPLPEKITLWHRPSKEEAAKEAAEKEEAAEQEKKLEAFDVELLQKKV